MAESAGASPDFQRDNIPGISGLRYWVRVAGRSASRGRQSALRSREGSRRRALNSKEKSMSFSINTNIASLQAMNYLTANSRFQSKTINEVTSVYAL